MATAVTDDVLSPASRSAARYRWYVLGMLVILGALSWIDRQLLAMVMQSVKSEFSLTDTQLGLLGGTGTSPPRALPSRQYGPKGCALRMSVR